MTNQIPPDVDWVKERTACTAAVIFEVLKADVSRDVASRQEAISAAEYKWPSLSFYPEATNFKVVLHGFNGRKGREVHKAIAFVLDGQEISVLDENLRAFIKARPTLGDDGRCRLMAIVGDKELELELWQFRRRALESLFFNADLP